MDTSHDSTFLDLMWNSPHVEIGSGYDFAHRLLRASPFVGTLPLQKASKGGSGRADWQTISTTDDKKKLLKSETSITIPIKGSTLKLENEWLNSVEVSKTKFSKVIIDYYEDPPMKLDYRTNKPKLNDRALGLLKKGWEDFTAVYGEYFVYGYIERASFNAQIDITTSDETTRDELLTKLSLDIKGKAGIETTFKKISENKSSRATVKTTVRTMGLSDSALKRRNILIQNKDGDDGVANPKEKVFETSDIGQAYDAYNDWQSSYEKQPWKALLCHYSEVYDGAPMPQDQFKYLGGEVEDMYKELFDAQIQLAGSNMRGAQDTAKRATTLVQDILKLEPENPEKLQKLQKDIDAVKVDVNKWRLREELLDNLSMFEEHWDKVPDADSAGWVYESKKEYFTFGLYDFGAAPTFAPIFSDHEYEEIDCHLSNAAGTTYTTYDIGNSSRITVGLQIHNKWHDNSNGWWRHKDGNVGTPTLRIEFCTQSGRGMHWSISQAYINKDLYRRI